jgi:hypothetical protein
MLRRFAACVIDIQHVELAVDDGDAFRNCSAQVPYGFSSFDQDWILNGRRMIGLRRSHPLSFHLSGGVT